MSDISLVYPVEELESAVADFIEAFFDNGEPTVNGSHQLDMGRYTYAEWLQMMRNNLNAETVDPKFGPSHTLFAVTPDRRIVGVVDIRLSLADFYKGFGNIGYSVRPTERRKGYATEILRQALQCARDQGLTEVYLTCKSDNGASRKTILKNGGVLIRTFTRGGAAQEEYRITL